MHHLVLIFKVLSVALFLSSALPLRAASPPPPIDGPSYDETVKYLQARISGTFRETRECFFDVGRNDGQGDFVATEVLPHITYDAWGSGRIDMHLSCNSGGCFNQPKSDQHFTLYFNNGDPPKIARALQHLVELCGGEKPQGEIF